MGLIEASGRNPVFSPALLILVTAIGSLADRALRLPALFTPCVGDHLQAHYFNTAAQDRMPVINLLIVRGSGADQGRG